jgi:hypothetical protein
MKAPNTFAARARSNRIAKNAQTVTDSAGSVLRITRARRVLSVRSPMSGQWRTPAFNDGFRNRNGGLYVTGPLEVTRPDVAKILYPY